ncbi:MAG: GNAT family N-acetyltransferase [Candidatus Eremiobacteraeota bacterium]|nr:GNAT family N-acetyltransferase [Candidatus Eremiobacteraeota bacterium]
MRTILHTARLTLRELELSDLDFIATLLGDRDVMRFWGRDYNRDESRDWIVRQRERYASDGQGYWLASDRLTGEPLGQAGVVMQPVHGSEEPGLAYILARAHWHKGLATEAAAASLDYIRDALRRPHAVCLVRPENLASIAVARKLGLSEEMRMEYYGFEHIVFGKTFARPPRTEDASA